MSIRLGTGGGSGSGASGALEVIAETELAAAAATFDFAAIAQTYRHLKLVVMARTDRASTNDTLQLRLNGDTGLNYDDQYLRASSTTVSGAVQQNQASARVAFTSGATSPAGDFAVAELLLPFYRSTAARKRIVGVNGGTFDSAAATSHLVMSVEAIWKSTAAITQITLLPGTGPNFVAGSIATLYGVNGA